METYQAMFQNVGIFLNTVEEVQPPPLHSQISEGWWSFVEQEWTQMLHAIHEEIQDSEKKQTLEVLECFRIGYDCLSTFAEHMEDEAVHEKIQTLLTKPQSTQRTDEWYNEMKDVVSASEFYQLFSSPRTRGQLVLSKLPQTGDSTPSSRRKACLTMEMSPFDWGIRFEPVAKLYLEYLWSAKILDLGRLRHPTLEKLAASPDGIITEVRDLSNAHLFGDLVEIKCPSSRRIGTSIPSAYWYQMQLQMEVTESPVCQYAEFTFRSFTAQSQTCDEPKSCLQKGVLYLLENASRCELKYEYGPIGDMTWEPPPEEGWEILEKIPWYLEKIWIQPVIRDQAWFQSILPLLDIFWKDVELAKKGEFIVPESTVKKKPVQCAIVDTED
jgi:hypothetical protein